MNMKKKHLFLMLLILFNSINLNANLIDWAKSHPFMASWLTGISLGFIASCFKTIKIEKEIASCFDNACNQKSLRDLRRLKVLLREHYDPITYYHYNNQKVFNNIARTLSFEYADSAKGREFFNELFLYGVDINKRDEITNNAILHDAIREGNYSKVKALLYLGASLDLVDSMGTTPYMLSKELWGVNSPITQALICPEKAVFIRNLTGNNSPFGFINPEYKNNHEIVAQNILSQRQDIGNTNLSEKIASFIY